MVLVSISVVENLASEAYCHTWRQEVVKGEHGHPVDALLPSVLGLVVPVAKPFEGDLQKPRGCQKKHNIEIHFFPVSVTDCFMVISTHVMKRSFSINSSDCFMTVFTPFEASSDCVQLWTGNNLVANFLPQHAIAHIKYESRLSEK